MARVLVVDDNAALALAMQALLARGGHKAEVAHNPDAAIARMREGVFDAVISDVVMPGQDGFQLGRRIRENPLTAGIPIIYLTSLDSMEDEFEGYLAGGDAWITKPFSARDLLRKLDEVLSGRAPQVAARRAVAGGYRVIGAVTGPRSALLDQACRAARCRLEAAPTLEAALARADREPFDLLVCEVVPGSDVIGMVKAFLDHFALDLPALFLLERATGRTTPGSDLHALLLPASAQVLAARMDEILRGQSA